MRIWSIHPSYLDRLGLLALWRESLLAQHVLLGKTVGYKMHPQLLRFKQQDRPLAFLANYLHIVCNAADAIGYRFTREKIALPFDGSLLQMTVTFGQLNYEWSHFLDKIKVRDKERFIALREIKSVDSHPSFIVQDGDIELWERNVRKH